MRVLLEQVRGIEPPCSAWEADILPLNYTCTALNIIANRLGKCKHFFASSGFLRTPIRSTCLYQKNVIK